MDDRTSDASANSMAGSQEDFRSTLIDLDGTCIVTGDIAEDCEASRCLPHSKGDQVHFSFGFG
jgi:hypothetical protein